MKPFGIIYLVTNLVNLKQYVGQTTQALETRMNQHFSTKRQDHFHRGIRKHGKENFQFKELETCESLAELNFREEVLIIKYDSLGSGYNSIYGGDVYEKTKAMRKKQSKATKKFMDSLSPEQKIRRAENCSKAQFKRATNETPKQRARRVEKQSKASIRHRANETSEQKIERSKNSSKAGIKRAANEAPEFKARRVSNRKKTISNRTPEQTAEVSKRISDSKSKDYEVTYPDGKIEITHNLTQFCRENNLGYQSMRLVANGKQKHHQGYTCKKILSKKEKMKSLTAFIVTVI